MAHQRATNDMTNASGNRPSFLPLAVNRLPPGSLGAALIIALSLWILHGFLQALLAACVTAVASWPLYTRFGTWGGWRKRPSFSALTFTLLVSVFVLAPLAFASGALLTEASALLGQVAVADRRGIAAPDWLQHVPMIGRWLVERWQLEFAYPGALQAWTQRTDATALLALAESLGQFMARHAFIIAFTILLLFFLYREGNSLAANFRRLLRHSIGERADGYIDLATRAVRASVNSMLIVALFDGFATAIVYVIAGVPQAGLWAAITGLLALVPFLGYVAVAALAVQLTLTDGATSPLLVFALGCLVLFCGDKVLRPLFARDGMRLRFVWILMGCLGGFEALGLVGVVIGPVVLTLVRELWEQRIRDLAVAATTTRGRPHDAMPPPRLPEPKS